MFPFCETTLAWGARTSIKSVGCTTSACSPVRGVEAFACHSFLMPEANVELLHLGTSPLQALHVIGLTTIVTKSVSKWTTLYASQWKRAQCSAHNVQCLKALKKYRCCTDMLQTLCTSKMKTKSGKKEVIVVKGQKVLEARHFITRHLNERMCWKEWVIWNQES